MHQTAIACTQAQIGQSDHAFGGDFRRHVCGVHPATGWHLPLFIRPGWESSQLWIYLLIMTGLSVIMTYAANLSRFSLITVVTLHAAFNTASRFQVGLFQRLRPSRVCHSNWCSHFMASASV